MPIAQTIEIEVTDDAWIDREGTVYEIEYGSHEDWAKSNMDCGSDELEERGWLHLSEGDMYYHCNIRLTDKQEGILIDWCFANCIKPSQYSHWMSQ